MFKALLRLKPSDWAVVLTGLAVVVALEFLPEADVTRPITPQAELERPNPGASPQSKLPDDAPPIVRPPAPPTPETAQNMLPGLPDVPQFGADSVQVPANDPALPGPVRDVFDAKFRNPTYFAAFAYSPKGGYGWATGYSTAAAARTAALYFCGQNAKDCRIVAERFPADLQGEPPARSLSSEQTQTYLAYHGKQHPAAFVSAIDGAYGAATATTTGEAINKAYSLCLEHLRKDNGLDGVTCKVLKVWD